MSRIIKNPQELILSKAKEILYNEGYSKLTMRNVSKACDISLGTIYNYYPTKKELVVEMMTDYWREYMDVAQTIASSNNNFYERLNQIFDTLNIFIKTFRDAWLKPELYDNPDYVSSGVEREHIYIEKLVLLIEDTLKKDNKVNDSLGYYETAKFIVMNFITIIQMPLFKYSSFEVVLKELLN